jgi:SAM-dependent methyltransferase
MSDLTAHWERVYRGGGAHSWDQEEASVAVRLLEAAGVGPGASVVDVGGGDGALAAALIGRGFRDLTVLDISAHGLAAGRRRLGPAAEQVAWVVADVRFWRPPRHYDCWHDRAVFHFLVDPGDRTRYGEALSSGTAGGAVAVVGTFAADGPQMCSGLPVARYDADRLRAVLSAASGVGWQLVGGTSEQHRTPAGAVQPFTWVVVRRPGRERGQATTGLSTLIGRIGRASQDGGR